MTTISVCTVCMNRLFHVRETLPANILANKNCKNTEFVLLDYNSTDGLENWVKAKMMKYIDNGLLRYFRTEDPTHFSLCHSKNMVSKLATGDIIAIIDADNYTGTDYNCWVNTTFENNGENTIITTIRKTFVPYRDAGGKVAFHRNLFTKTRGFDESWVGYGFDDVDYVNRLELNGGKRIFIENPEYLKCITHSHVERLANNYLMENIGSIYICSNPESSTNVTILYLLQNSEFLQVDFHYDEFNKNNQFLTYDGWTIDLSNKKEGEYLTNEEGIALISSNYNLIYYRTSSTELKYSIEERQFHWVEAPVDTYIDLVLRYSECIGRKKYVENIEKRGLINKNDWGRGTVYLNFNRQNPINLY